MLTTEKKYLSPEEYLRIERDALIKSEYYKGEMFAMSGASLNHNIISGNIFAALHKKLINSDSIAFTSDVKICVSENGLFTYPDISVVKGEILCYDDLKDVVLNPIIIFEVLSESTQNYDRGGKFNLYRNIKTLEEYILVSQDEVSIEHFHKYNESEWILTEFKSKEEVIILNSVGFSLNIDDIYFKVKF